MRRQAFTLVEVLVTIAVLAVVMTLLTVPLLSSLGYVKKAKAISEAKTAALKAVDTIKADVEEASVIFDFPVTGEGITFLADTTDPDTGKVTSQTMRRYMRVLDFPWYWGGLTAPAKWTLLQPDYVDGKDPRYEDRYSPFHKSEKAGIEPRNPYVITAYSLQKPFDWSENSAEVWNYSYPLNFDNPDPTVVDYISLENSMKNRTVLERMLRNDLQSITPYGAGWDIPAFVISPVRVNNETLSMDKDSGGNPKTGVVFSRNGLWAGRNQMLDEWVSSGRSGWYSMVNQDLTKLYGEKKVPLTKDYVLNGTPVTETDLIILKDINMPFYKSTDLTTKLLTYSDIPFYKIIKEMTPFYPINSNPFGYKIKIYDSTATLRYGTSVDNTTLPKPTYRIVLDRHFMDWPEIGRNEIDPNETSQSKLFNIKLKYVKSIVTADVNNNVVIPVDDTSLLRAGMQIDINNSMCTVKSIDSTTQLTINSAITVANGSKLSYTWSDFHPTWTKADIDAQRLAGKLVFSQPMAPLRITKDAVDGKYYLPIPYGWDPILPNYSYTYLSSPPRKIIIWDGEYEKSKETFVYVKKAFSDLGIHEFTINTVDDKYDYVSNKCKKSRQIFFGKRKNGIVVNDSEVDIWYDEPYSEDAAVQSLYYICDLQPTDVVTASYSTKGQIDLMLTLARQDTAARSPEQSRQDYAVSIRLEAKNAVRRALDSR